MGEFAAELPKARMPAFRLRSLGDDRLGRLVAAGDERAFAVVYQRYQDALYRYCRSIVGDPEDAADALQNTMAAALRGLTGEKREIRLKPWLFRIAHNECVSMLRSRRPQVAIDESLELVAPDGLDAGTRERLRQLVADLQQLPTAQRSALVMRELSGLGYDEIAAALGGNVAAARQSVFEARSALHELAEGRAMECESVRRALSDNDGRVLRGRKLRAHLRACGSCRDFRDLIGTRRRDLALIAPPIPAALAAGLLHHVLGGAATASGGAGTGVGGAGLGSLAAGKAVAASTAMKAAAIVACTAAVGAGTVETVREVEHSTSSPKSTKATPTPPVHQLQPAGGSGHMTVNSSSRGSTAATTHSNHTAATKHGSHVKKHTAPSEKSHSHKGKTHTNHAGGNSGGGGKSEEHQQARIHEHPEHPTTPAGKGDTPASTKGPPATTPAAPVKTTPTHTTPELPAQAQNGVDLSGSQPGASGRSKGIGQGLAN
jgi:RNA polymerase sigma factor (sigma-70 family)